MWDLLPTADAVATVCRPGRGYEGKGTQHRAFSGLLKRFFCVERPPRRSTPKEHAYERSRNGTEAVPYRLRAVLTKMKTLTEELPSKKLHL
jgi:hypothetical protein